MKHFILLTICCFLFFCSTKFAFAFCFGDFMCNCDQRCVNFSCQRISPGLVPNFCSGPIGCNSDWDIENHTITYWKDTCGVNRHFNSCSMSFPDHGDGQYLACSVGCGAQCDANNLNRCTNGQSCNLTTCSCTTFCSTSCNPNSCPSGWSPTWGSCAGFGSNYVCCQQNNTPNPTSPPNNGGGNNNNPPPPAPTACANASIGTVNINPKPGQLNQTASATVFASNATRVDVDLTVTDNKDSHQYVTGQNGGMCSGTTCKYTFPLSTPGFPTSQPGEIYTYKATFNAWNSCGGNVVNHFSTGTTTMIYPYIISGTTFIDYNNNGIQESTEPILSGVIISAQDTTSKISLGSDTSDTNGNYSFNNAPSGHTVSLQITTPFGYQVSTNPIIITNIQSNKTANIGLSPTYTISGLWYIDNNTDGYFTPNVDSIYTGNGGQIRITGPAKSNPIIARNTTQGIYTISNLISGTYTLTLAPPTGYTISYPPSSSFVVTVGKPNTSITCNAGNYYASCDTNGNIVNLMIGITAQTWSQIVCSDTRSDTGITNSVPGAGVSCGTTSSAYAMLSTNSCPNSPGIIYTGDSDANIGAGNASSKNWIAGGSQYPETFYTPQGEYRSSYSYILQTINKSCAPPKDFIDICPILSDCNLSSILDSGIYKAPGDVTLNGFTPVIGKNYIFLIDGDLTINENIIIPQGTTAIFAVKGNIIIDKSVGNSDTTQACDITQPGHPGCNIEGFYTTEKDFIIQSTKTNGGVCNDLRLNIAGNVIISDTGGSLINNRTLCNQNLTCPVYTITARPDLWLNSFAGNRCLLHPNFSQKEIPPNQ